MKTLVVYYSLEGNTEFVARQLQERSGADLLKLVPKKAYKDKGLSRFLWGGKSAVMAESPELEDFSLDLAAYQRIVFGFPVWASTFAPPLRSFVERYQTQLQGKNLVAFACQRGTGAEKAFVKLAKCIGVEGFEKTAVFIDPKSRPGDEKKAQIEAFCEAMR